jgi:hypothetical protein
MLKYLWITRMDNQGIISAYDIPKRRFTRARCKTGIHTSAEKMSKMRSFLGMSKRGAQTR